jgi:hypothetical protein
MVRLALGICSLGLFFAIFFIVCAGSRYARQGDSREGRVENSSDADL